MLYIYSIHTKIAHLIIIVSDNLLHKSGNCMYGVYLLYMYVCTYV